MGWRDDKGILDRLMKRLKDSMCSSVFNSILVWFMFMQSSIFSDAFVILVSIFFNSSRLLLMITISSAKRKSNSCRSSMRILFCISSDVLNTSSRAKVSSCDEMVSPCLPCRDTSSFVFHTFSNSRTFLAFLEKMVS